ncbi:hypothetical protein [Streptomyces sp. KR80]
MLPPIRTASPTLRTGHSPAQDRSLLPGSMLHATAGGRQDLWTGARV